MAAKAKILPAPQCVLLLAHAFLATTAFKLGAGSIPVAVDSSNVSPDGASGLPNFVSSDGGLLDRGSRPLDPVVGALDEPADFLIPVLNALVGNPEAELARLVDLSDAGLVDALKDPLGLADITNQLSTALLGVVGNLTSVVVPDELAYGPAPDVEARRFNLKTERHYIVTPDGYILTVFRFRSACTIPDRVVILTSNALMNSANFIFLQEESLAYKLAWQCNDVWIVPFRGSRWAAEHTTLSRDDPAFWNSTILELGIYDLRTGIEFVSECTGSTSIRLITSDVGASALVTMNSKLGDDSPQCRLGHAYIIEPFICMQHTKSVLYLTLKVVRDVLRIAGNLVVHNEVPLGDKPLHTVVYLLCAYVTPEICILLHKIGAGTSDSMDPEAIPYMSRYFLDNIQVPIVVHIGQTMRSDRCLCEFDYGKPRNLVLYNSERPPAYDILATFVSISLYVNEKSTLVPKEDWLTTYDSFRESARRRFFVIKDGNFLTTFIPKNPDAFFYDKLLADMEEDYRSDCIAACTKPCRSCK